MAHRALLCGADSDKTLVSVVFDVIEVLRSFLFCGRSSAGAEGGQSKTEKNASRLTKSIFMSRSWIHVSPSACIPVCSYH